MTWKRNLELFRPSADASTTAFFRPSTYTGTSTTTFAFYNDSWFTEIRAVAAFFDLVEFDMLKITYIPP